MIGRHLRRLWRGIGRQGAVGTTEPAVLLEHGSGPTAGAVAAPSSLRQIEGWAAEEVDRLVRLTFNALLEREPGRDTLLAYREGFANGTTLHGLIEDVLRSDECAAVQESARRLRAVPASLDDGFREGVDGEDFEVALALLEKRLAEMGCELDLGPPEGTIDDVDPGHRRRMRSLTVTLSVLQGL